jgi:hypothetical protein
MKAMKSTMKNNYIPIKLIMLGIIVTLGCERQEVPLPAATYSNSARVWDDGFAGGGDMDWHAYADAKLTAFEVDENESYSNLPGSSSMRLNVPYSGDPDGGYAGGIIRDMDGRNLSEYNAVTFYAKGSRTGMMDAVGFGQDFLGDKYAAITSIGLNTTWQKYVIPIPDPSLLTQEKGLFAIAEGPEDGQGYSIWIDQVKYEKLETIVRPRCAIMGGEDVTQKTFIGSRSELSDLTYTVNLPNSVDQVVTTSPYYFTFQSSDTTVAKVAESGAIQVVGQGTAVITAKIGALEASGSLTLESLGEFTAAPVPDRPEDDVISIFSDAYTNAPVEYYNGFWAPFQTTLGGADIVINDDHVIRYTQLNFVGTQFSQPTVDASEKTHFHIDIQVEEDMQTDDFLRITLNDFGPDGSFEGDDNSGGSVTFKSPVLKTGEWVSLDIPLSDFTGLTSTANMAQIVLASEGTIFSILVDNMYFYKDGGGGGECQQETAQSLDASDFNMTFQTDPGSAIGSFGGVYSYIDNPDSDNDINPSCKVGQITRDGQQFANTQIEFDSKFDFNANAGFKLKVWSPTAGTNVLVKLEDKTNADVNTEVSAVTTTASAWEELTFDFASGESGKHDKIILFFELDSNIEETYYIDDFRLYGSGGETCQAETSQSMDASDFDMTFQTDPGSAIGSFGGAYSYIDNPDFDNAVNPSCKVGQITRDGQQFANTQIEFDSKFDFNANAGFKLKVWSPTAGTNVLVKLEDKTNADVNTEVSAVTTTASAWEELTFDFATGESGKHDKIILFFELDSNVEETYYIDDFRLYGSGGGGPSAPTDAPAAPPARDAADVISIYGEAYGAEIGLANVDWDNGSTFAEETIAGNKLLKIDFADFLGTQLNTVVDATAMTNFHMDVWIADDFEAGQIFNPKWSNHTGGAGETNAFELTKAVGDTDAKKWIAIDVPITDFAGDATRADLTQFLIAVAGKIDVAYVDNIYFYKGGSAGPSAPTDAPAAPPARDAADVISIYGEAYGAEIGLANVDWDNGSTFAEETIAGNKLLKIDFADFLGTQLNTVVDATAMTNFHMDVWIADDFEAGQIFNPKWSNHTGGAGETNAFELTKAVGDTDAKKWIAIDVPITDFAGDATRADLTQFLIAVAGKIDVAYVDNIYFYKGGSAGPSAPTDAPAAPPARDAADVISIYGEAYGAEIGLANVDWDNGSTFAEETIAGNKLLKIDFADFLGTQLNTVVDATAMTNFHMDVWIADDFEAGQIFNPKWSNHTGGAGETNAFELTKAVGDTDAKKWIAIDVPITDFAGDATRADLTQFLIAVAGKIDVAYVDNIYFYKGGSAGPSAPTDAPAAPPARDAADVISIYGEAYGAEIGLANVDWDNGSTFAEETIAGNKLLKIDFADFLGTQLNTVVDATAMTNFHMDVWIADDFEAGQIFNPKWSNHTGGAGETNAFELTKAVGDTDAKKWIAIDVPITDFAGDATRADLTQFLIAVAGKIDVAYVDNIYFYKGGGSGGPADPSTAAPAPPARDAADVVSIFSDAYTNITLDNDDAGWCGADAASVVSIEGNNTWKKNTGIDCHGIDFSTNKQDLSAFTHIHFDFYTDDADLIGAVFNVKLVDFGGGGGEASALEVNINTGTTPGIVSGSWVSVDIDITALGGVVAGNLSRSDIAQIGITTANLTNVWYDNIYLYK